jgi:hypothetical protein
MSDTEYENFSALLMDNKTQIFSDDSKLMLDYKYNQVSISNEGINLNLKDNDQELLLGHNYANQSAVLGDAFFNWMDGFVNTLLQPSSMMGNMIAPVLKPLVDTELTKYKALRETFVSQHVKIVDNGSCLDTGEDRKNSVAQDDQTLLNDEKILKSKLVSSDVKKTLLTKRETEYETSEESKPNEEDAAFKEDDVYNDLDGPGEEKITTETSELDIDSLDDETKNKIEKTENISKRKSSKTKKEIEEPDGDPYSSMWVGYQGRSSDSFAVDKVESETYGDYTSGGATGDYKEYKGKSKTRKTKDGRTVENGKLADSDLVEVEGFHIYGKSATIRLETNAAEAFKKLNTAFIVKFGTPLSVNGNSQHYRTYEQQMGFWINYKNGTGSLAAKPGTSAHGWGLALDLGGTNSGNSKIYKWLTDNAPTYDIKRTVNKTMAKESWHWVYVGKSVYS